jgi:ribosomal protein L11 methyltransferase
MTLKSLIFELDAEEANALSDACFDAGALSVSADDPLVGTPDEVPMYGEPGMKEAAWPNTDDPATWPRLRLTILLDEATDAAAFMADAARAAGLAAVPAFRIEAVPDDDWVRKTQTQFQPIRISDRLWIVPSWHEQPDSNAINIELDPGVAFGTGSHPTTQLCLQWLERRVQGGESVLDYGCGSGILAIAAARLGAGRVVGVDIDPAAVAAARDNAGRNHVAAEFLDVTATLSIEADMLVANILSNPLKMLAPALSRHVRPGGIMALSGVLAAQAEEVMDIYRAWFEFEPPRELEGWVCLSGQRKA